MAINFCPSQPFRMQKSPDTLPAGPVGVVSVYSRADASFPETDPPNMQRLNNNFMREPEEYNELRELGVGSNGKAILLERRRDRSLLVVKISNPFRGWSTTTIASEAFLLKHRLPQNDRIIRLQDYLQSAHVPQIQMYFDFCDGGDLGQLIEHYDYFQRTLPESFAWHAFRQTAEALAFIHYGYDYKLGPNQRPPSHWKQVIHADLKPDNLLLRTSKIPGAYPDLVLADFGNSVTNAGFHIAGAAAWLPPERYMCSEKADTWTMGAIISCLAWGGAPPFRSSHGHMAIAVPLGGIPLVHRCAKEVDAVFVRPMLTYSHELNDLVARTCDPHRRSRLTSWECSQLIWHEMEVGAARSHPFVPLMFGWERLWEENLRKTLVTPE